MGTYKVTDCKTKNQNAPAEALVFEDFNQLNEKINVPAPRKIEANKDVQQNGSQKPFSSSIRFLKPKANSIPAIVIKAAEAVITPLI
jgi:hypothetical protein